MKLRNKLLLNFIILIGLIILVLEFVTTAQISLEIQKDVEERGQREAEQLAQHLHIQLDEYKHDVSRYAKNANVLRYFQNDKEEIEAIDTSFQNYLAEKEEVGRIFIVDKKGKGVQASKQKTTPFITNIDERLTSEVLEKQDEEHIQTVYYDKTYEGWLLSIVKAVSIDDQIVGLMAIELPLKALDEIVEGFGVSYKGYAYLVDRNGFIMSHPEYQGHHIQEYENLKNINVYSSGYDTFKKEKDIYHMYYEPVEGLAVGVIYAENEMYQLIHTIRHGMIVIAVIALIVSSLFIYIFARRLTRPIEEMTSVVQKMGERDFTVRTSSSSKDEIGALSQDINETLTTLTKTFKQFQHTSQNLAQSAERVERIASDSYDSNTQVSKAVHEVAEGATVQAEQLENVQHVMSQLTARFEQLNKASEEMDQSSEMATEASQKGARQVQDLMKQSEDVFEQIIIVEENVAKLERNVKNVHTITEVIRGISDQTSLLALNASIEAARAGESGRGFAVVANEIRALADESYASTEEIAQLLDEISKQTEMTVMKMKEARTQIESQKEFVGQTGSSFEEIQRRMSNLQQDSRMIYEAVDQMTASRQTVVSAIEQLSAVSEEQAAASEEVSAASEEQTAASEELERIASRLAEESEQMTNEIQTFKIDMK